MQCLSRREAFGAIESCPGDLFSGEIVLDEIDNRIRVGSFIIIIINIIIIIIIIIIIFIISAYPLAFLQTCEKRFSFIMSSTLLLELV